MIYIRKNGARRSFLLFHYLHDEDVPSEKV